MKKFEFKVWIKEAKNRTLLVAITVMLLIILVVETQSQKTTTGEDHPESADTFIPPGFVLVPIELQNSESLSSLIGSYAVVDLFVGGPNAKHQRVGQRLKLLRAPLNPQQFAVLVPENQVNSLLSVVGPYWAVIQNPSEKKTGQISEKKKSKVEYFQGDRS